MTKITYRNDETRFAIRMQGHAGYAEHGKDIVCAAVSVLANELVLACTNAEQTGEISHLHMMRESGLVALSFHYEKVKSVDDIIKTILACLYLIEQDYRAFLQIKECEV